MKNLTTGFLGVLILLAFSKVSVAQNGEGQVVFDTVHNGTMPGTLITFGPGSGSLTGEPLWGPAGSFTFGLYIGPSTATSLSQMILIDTVGSSPAETLQSSPFAGMVVGGTVAGAGNAGSANGFSGMLAGITYDFYVAGWSTAAGSSYSEAIMSGLPQDFAGISELGNVVPTSVNDPIPPPWLFGTGDGQIGGFELKPIPEPSTIVLGGLSAAAIWALRRREQLIRSR